MRRVAFKTAAPRAASVVGPGVKCGRAYLSSPGMVLTEPAGERHANHFSERGARVVIMQPDPEREEMLRPFAAWLGRPNHFVQPGAYIRRLRIVWAAHQLATSDVPIASIAALAGFADQSHFTRSFRICNGVTPAVFRAQLRGTPRC